MTLSSSGLDPIKPPADDMRMLTAEAIESKISHYSGDVVIDAGYFRAVLDLIPPSTSEIIAALERLDPVQYWSPSEGAWLPEPPETEEYWQEWLEMHGDQPHPGWRIIGEEE